MSHQGSGGGGEGRAEDVSKFDKCKFRDKKLEGRGRCVDVGGTGGQMLAGCPHLQNWRGGEKETHA